MSIGCINNVFRFSEASGNDRLVLIAIADEANDEGENAFPSVRRLASKAHCHTDTVIECIKHLEALGELEVLRPEKQGRGRFNRYRVTVEEKVGNSDHSAGSVLLGQFTGLARVDPRQNDTSPAPKRQSVRPLGDGVARFPQGTRGCEECAGGWIEGDDGSAVECKGCLG